MVAGSADNASNNSDTGKPQPVLESYNQFSDLLTASCCLFGSVQKRQKTWCMRPSCDFIECWARKKCGQTLRAWLFRVAHNLAISLKRKSGEASDELILPADIRESGGDPETGVLHEEWVLRLQRPPGYPNQLCVCLRRLRCAKKPGPTNFSGRTGGRTGRSWDPPGLNIRQKRGFSASWYNSASI